MNRTTARRGRVARGASLLGVATIAGCIGGTEYAQTTFHPISDYGRDLNVLFMNTFWWTMPIMVLVFVLLFYILIRFREKPGQPRPKQIHGNTMLELIWTFVPAVIVTFIAVPTVSAVFHINRRASPDALEIEVIGHQWWWEFRYPSEEVVTANHMVLPAGREVHLRIWSADVVHSFWVPRIGGKRDAVPQPRMAEGERPRPNHIVFTADEPGQWRGQCAEYCGEAHAIMAAYAQAVSPEEFEAWVASMKDAPTAAAPGAPAPEPAAAVAGGVQDTTAQAARVPESLVAEGARVFASRTCIACHTIANTTARGVVGPSLTRFAIRPTVGAGALPNTQENVERWIRDPQAVKAGALMPGATSAGGGFPPTGLTDDEIRAVAAYLLSLQ